MDVRATITDAVWGDHHGREIVIRATLTDPGGRGMPGIVPATLTVGRPDGKRSDYSRHTAFNRGELLCRVPLSTNAPKGIWTATILERASGREMSVTIAQ